VNIKVGLEHWSVHHMKRQIDFSRVSCTNYMERIIDCILKGLGQIEIRGITAEINSVCVSEKNTRAEKTKLKKMAQNSTRQQNRALGMRLVKINKNRLQ
jgi:hypothetical protein